MHANVLIFMGTTFLFSSCTAPKDFTFQFSKTATWHYEISGCSSKERRAPSDQGDHEAIVQEIDTVEFFVEDVVKLGPDSTLYHFSEDLGCHWSNQILSVKEGYLSHFPLSQESFFFLKRPVATRNQWESRLPYGYVREKFEIVATDTIFNMDEKVYTGCIFIRIERFSEGKLIPPAQMWLNEEYGLIYYAVEDGSDVVKLLQMIPRK